jgi:hypothetical protein
MAIPFNPLPEAPDRRKFIGRMGRMALRCAVAMSVWPAGPAVSAAARAVPPMDAAVPAGLETATFGLG